MNSFFKIALIICNIIICITCEQICYDGYGCFTNDYPFGQTWQRPISKLPEKPSKINTKFYLYTRNTTECV